MSKLVSYYLENKNELGHASTLHSWTMDELPTQSFPPFSASVDLFLVMKSCPPPHVLVHSPVFHLSHTQSTVWNEDLVFYWLVVAMLKKWNTIKWKTFLIHDLLGQSLTLHCSVIVADPEHSIPPCASLILLLLVFVLCPPPQVFEHSPTFHSSHSQSTKYCNNESDMNSVVPGDF